MPAPVFPFVWTQFPDALNGCAGSCVDGYYNHPDADAVQLQVTLGGDATAWSTGPIAGFAGATFDLGLNHSGLAYPVDSLELPLFVPDAGFGDQIEVSFYGSLDGVETTRYVQTDTVTNGAAVAGDHIYPGVAAISPYAGNAYIQAIWRGAPMWVEFEFGENPARSNPETAYNGYTHFGDQNGGFVLDAYGFPGASYYRKFVEGVLSTSADVSAPSAAEMVLGCIYSGDASGGMLDLYLHGELLHSYPVPFLVEAVYSISEGAPSEYSLANYAGFAAAIQFAEYNVYGVTNGISTGIYQYDSGSGYVWHVLVFDDSATTNPAVAIPLSSGQLHGSPADGDVLPLDTYLVKFASYHDAEPAATLGDPSGVIYGSPPSMMTHPRWLAGVSAPLGTAFAPLAVRVGMTGACAAPLMVRVGMLGMSAAPLHIAVNNASAHTSAALAVRVGALGTTSAALKVAVTPPTGRASAPMRVSVIGQGTTRALLAVRVRDDTPTLNWTVSLRLGGIDISARLVGEVSVDAEEGAARVANLTLLPPSGPFDVFAYTGATVELDVVLSGIATRLFTGRVDVPSWEPASGLIRLECHDDLQNRVAAMSRAEIDQMIAGRYSVSIHGELTDERWRYAQSRLETRAASLDADCYGNPRVSDWLSAPVAATFGDGHVFDGTVELDLPPRASIRNEIEVRVQYRYTRLRDRRASVGWTADPSYSPSARYAGWQYPDLTTVSSAVSGAGWQIVQQVALPAPATVSVSAGGETLFLDIPRDRIAGYTAHVAQRHAQTITETHTITVRAPTSIIANGRLPDALSGSVASGWDGTDWESDLSVAPEIAQGWMDWAPDVPRSGVPAVLPPGGFLSGGGFAGGPYPRAAAAPDCAATSDRGMAAQRDTFENATLALLDTAHVRILSSHRLARARFTVALQPTLDLPMAVMLDTARVAASGKLARVRHALDLSSGSATTELSIALFGARGTGIVTPDSIAAPTQPLDTIPPQDWSAELPHLGTLIGGVDVYQPAFSGWLVNPPESVSMYAIVGGEREARTLSNPKYTPNPLPVSGFRITMPGVSDCNRNAAELRAESQLVMDIPQDMLVLSAF